MQWQPNWSRHSVILVLIVASWIVPPVIRSFGEGHLVTTIYGLSYFGFFAIIAAQLSDLRGPSA